MCKTPLCAECTSYDCEDQYSQGQLKRDEMEEIYQDFWVNQNAHVLAYFYSKIDTTEVPF
jgi:hypothetical protein